MEKINTQVLLDYCLEKRKSLTPTRALVIFTLAKYNKPKSAYDLREEINKKKYTNINISTIYRVLDFWIKMGLIHKIATLNKYLLCQKPKEKHIHLLNFCTKCENVVESCSQKMGLNFKKSTSELDLLLIKEHSIEVPVLCPRCS